MRTKILLLATLIAGVLMMGYASFAGAGTPTKNVTVLPKDWDNTRVKKWMKEVASKGLGVKCDHCHDHDDMSKDTDKKKLAREMMKMTMELNSKYPILEKKVICATCHNGAAEPKNVAK